MSKPQGMCVLKLVNKYRSEGGERRRGFPYKKKRGKIKCLRRLETCSHQLHFEQQFWFLLLPADLFLLPLCCRNNRLFIISCSKTFFFNIKKKIQKHPTPNSTQIPISPYFHQRIFGASLPWLPPSVATHCFILPCNSCTTVLLVTPPLLSVCWLSGAWSVGGGADEDKDRGGGGVSQCRGHIRHHYGGQEDSG